MRVLLLSTFGTLTALTGLCALSAPAHAQVLFDPASVTTTMGQAAAAYSVTNTINQTGLSTPYISGVTTLASYTATHDSGTPQNDWLSLPPNSTGNVDFDMGTSLTLSSFVLWNTEDPQARVQGFTLIGSSAPTFSSSTTNLGSFTTDTTGSATAVNEEVFNFDPTTVRYIRMEITSNYGAIGTTMGEVAFADGASAPEPGALALLALGGLPLIGVLARRRRAPKRAFSERS